jgi:uncharacterized protein (TIGR03084 family)
LFLGGHADAVTQAPLRVPQEERSRAMRARLLEATVELLVEKGYAGTSTTLVSERAGVSRGAQLHHFPSKQDLVVAAVQHVTEVRGAELAAAAENLPRGAKRTRAVLQMLGDHFTSPVFTAALELWVAARTDPALLAEVGPLELRVGREVHRLTVELLGADESQPGVRELVQATLDLVRGLGLANTITDDARRRGRILDQWARTLDDLAAEGDQLRETVLRLGEDGWQRDTPAAGWTVATSVAHLLWTDEVAVLSAHSLRGEADKAAWDEVVLGAIADPHGFVDAGAHELAALPRDEVLSRWDAGRAALRQALTEVPDGAKMPWFGPQMSPASMATARFMETWAHALDVYDAAGSRPAPTDRIRHVAHLGIRTRNYAYSVQEEPPPAEELRVELTAPSGETWAWGPVDAAQSVAGSAYDFCLLVTQRVHRDDTDLVAVGDDAEHWLGIAQAFAGPSGPGRAAS